MSEMKRMEINEDALESVAGGNITISPSARTVKNNTTGEVFYLADGVDPKEAARYVLQYYNGNDSAAIDLLYAKNWLK